MAYLNHDDQMYINRNPTADVKTSFPQRSPGPRSKIGHVLTGQHCNAVVLAVSNVLATENTQLTMAQLLDGLPIVAVARESHGLRIYKDHPLCQLHTNLCAGALDEAKAWIADLNISEIEMETWTLHDFANTPLGSRESNLRLIEIVARTIHQIAVTLNSNPSKYHDEAEIRRVTAWEPPPTIIQPGQSPDEVLKHLPPRPTLFYNYEYSAHEQYPSGLADAAAYWAEDRIFGGVVLVDRGPSDSDYNDIYLHSGHRKETVRVWKLVEKQLNELVVFLTANADARGVVPSPIPISCIRTSEERVDSWDAMALCHIYRDPWERRLTPQKNWELIKWNTFDYPEEMPRFHALAARAEHDLRLSRHDSHE